MPIANAMAELTQLWIFVGSLVTILALFALARWMKLGGRPSIDSEDTAQSIAHQVEDGFEAQRVSISRAKDAALLRENAGRIMVIKRHGGNFAGRILTGQASGREEVDALVVDPGSAEKQFGHVRLRLDDAAYWADAINRL